MHEDELRGLSVRWEENGELVVDELAREVLAAKGGWATIAFLVREKDKENGTFEEPKVVIRRYRKRAKGFEVTAKIALPMEQAEHLVEAIAAWKRAHRP
jgi:hypothetical protein